MQLWKPPLIALAGALFFYQSSQAFASSNVNSRLEGLLDTVVTWLSANFDLPADYDHPEIRLKSAEYVSDVRYRSMKRAMRREVVAVYNDETETIFLTDSWLGRSPADISILIHEMVHHLQNKAELTYGCPQAREEVAYAAQDRWLGLFGKNLHQEFEIDPLVLMMTTKCLIP